MQGRNLDIFPTEKQYLAWQALNDPSIAEIHFGGGAGGGKTWLGCESRVARAYAYPGYKSFIARYELKRLMASAFVTFTKVCKHHQVPESDWVLNSKYNFIEFKNGSRIDLLDLANMPSDPMYERLGSLEFTDGWVEEAGEVPFMAIDILQSRVGRHMNTEFDLNPDTLYTYNPNKGWVYRIYKQYKEGTLPKDVVFIQSLYGDNPFTKDIYGQQLNRIKDASMRARLKDGSFDYDADPAQLMEYDAIIDLFTNTVDNSEEKYLSIDVARLGVDKTVMFLWKGDRIYGIRIYAKQDTAITSEKAKEVAKDEKIPFSHIIADEDGIGGAVVDNMRGITGFVGNSRACNNPITDEPENYINLRSQCYYTLAEDVNKHKIAIDIEPGQFISEVPGITFETFKELFIEELEAIKSVSLDKDQKMRVISKEDIKELIGRSPDFSDTLMMKMRFKYKTRAVLSGVKINRPSFAGFNRTK